MTAKRQLITRTLNSCSFCSTDEPILYFFQDLNGNVVFYSCIACYHLGKAWQNMVERGFIPRP